MLCLSHRATNHNLLLLSLIIAMVYEIRIARAAASCVILCFGDSWSHGNAHGLQRKLSSLRGHENVRIETVDHWGSTAEEFAKHPHVLPDAVRRYKADIVVLSLGGNDFKNIYWKHRQYIAPWTALTQIESSLRTVLEALYKEHPNVKVVTYGYDFPGSIHAVLNGKYLGETSTIKWLATMYSWFGVRFINYFSTRLGTTLGSLSKDFQKRGYSLTYVPLWGSLQQAAAADANKQLKGYSLSEPSPDAYMNDPIHANAKGFEVLAGKLYDSYLVNELSCAS